MKKSLLKQILYWVSILIILTLIFGFSWESHLLSFYFSALLLPIVIATTYFFNLFLVPKYLLTGRYIKFTLYFFYTLIVSLYFAMLVSLFSFVALAKMNTEAVNLEGISIFMLGITLYLIVFATSFIRLVNQFQKKEKLIATLKSDNKKNEQENILVRVDRKNQLISLNELAYIESLNDYVKLVTTESEFVTREKITNLNKKLPEKFIRIHRSFLVNSDKVNSFTTTEVNILKTNLPISRTYKKKAIEILESLPQNP